MSIVLIKIFVCIFALVGMCVAYIVGGLMLGIDENSTLKKTILSSIYHIATVSIMFAVLYSIIYVW